MKNGIFECQFGNTVDSMIKFLQKSVTFFAWSRIILSPLLIAAFLGFALYCSMPTNLGLILGIGLAILGLIAGIVLAKRANKREGVIEFVSRVNASPELNKDNQ